jgi:hypothetical protein
MLLREKIAEWKMIIPPDGSAAKERWDLDFWLGSSSDNRTWALATSHHKEKKQYSISAFLLDPPKIVNPAIVELLLMAYSAMENATEPVEPALIQSIADSFSFPEFLTAGELFPETPELWRDYRCKVSLTITPSENAMVTPSLFNEFRRDNLEDAMRIVCAPRTDNILIGYSLETTEVVPFLAWNCDWPLARTGKNHPEEREQVQGSLPWEFEPDATLLTIYQHLPGVGFLNLPLPFGEPTIRLSVGGRTPDEAIENWRQCAKPLRLLRKETLNSHD